MDLKVVSPKNTVPKPPKHLKAAGKKLWIDIARDFHVRDGAGL
jgi:hypothetical protein